MTTAQPCVPYYVRASALAIPIFLTAIQLWTWLLFVPAMVRTGTVDFRQAYAASYMLRSGLGNDLYDYAAQKSAQDRVVAPATTPLPYVAPAYEAFLLQPLSSFTFHTAYLLFALINAAAVVACFLRLRPWMGNIVGVYWGLPILLFAGFLPLAAAMMQGQDSIFLTVLLAAAYRAATNEKDVAAGALAGLALFKFSILVPIVILLMVWRRWRFLAGFFASAFALGLGCMAITGLSGQQQYVWLIMSLAGIHRPPVPLATYPVHWNLMANLHGLAYGLLHWCSGEHQVSMVALAAGVVLLAWVGFSARNRKDTATLLLIAIPTAVLASHHSYIHDLSPLIIPVVITLNRFLPNEGVSSEGNLQVRCAALTFAAPVVFSYATQAFWSVSIVILAFLYSLLTQGATEEMATSNIGGEYVARIQGSRSHPLHVTSNFVAEISKINEPIGSLRNIC